MMARSRRSFRGQPNNAVARAAILGGTLALMTTPPQVQLETVSLSWQGVPREYVVHGPKTHAPTTAWPLVIVLHGSGGDGASALRVYGWIPKADAAGFIVVAPNALPVRNATGHASFLFNPRIWSADDPNDRRTDIDDVGFLDHVISDISRRYRIDSGRIYVTGFSNGASMTWKYGAARSNVVAAIAPISGHLWVAPTALARPLPALLIAGREDPINPPGGGAAKALWGKPRNVPPMLDHVEAWARLVHCPSSTPYVSTARGVETYSYTGCQAEVRYELINGLGHRWAGHRDPLPDRLVGPPSDGIDATDTVWAFFARHSRTR